MLNNLHKLACNISPSGKCIEFAFIEASLYHNKHMQGGLRCNSMYEYVLRALIQENINKFVYWVSYVRWNVTYGWVGLQLFQNGIEQNKCTQLEISYVSCHMLHKNNRNKVQAAIVGICRQRLNDGPFSGSDFLFDKMGSLSWPIIWQYSVEARASPKSLQRERQKKKPFLQALSTDANYGCLNFVSAVLRQHMAWYIWNLKLCALVSFDSSLRGSHSHWFICHISTHIWHPAHKFAYVFLNRSTENVFTQSFTS